MQYIRKIKSSVNKIAYPSGVSQSLGTLSLDNSKKITDVTTSGYNDNSIFQNDDTNPSRWEMDRGTYVSKTTLKNGKAFGKMVAVQKRFSQDGTIFPPNVNGYLGTVYYNPTMGMKSLQHKLNIIRNATTYSPVQEIALFQAIVKADRRDFTPDLGIRVDQEIATPAGDKAVYLKPILTDIVPWNPNITGFSGLSATALDADMKQFNAIYNASGGGRVDSTDWIEVARNDRVNAPDVITNYIESAKSYYARFNRQYILIDLYDIDRWKLKLKYIRVNAPAQAAEGGWLIPIDQEMIDIAYRAKAKGYDKLALSLITMTGQLYDGETSFINRAEYIDAAMYRNDILEDTLEVDPAGQWIKIKLARPGKYTAWFNNEIYAFEKLTTDGNIVINKTNKLFTAGGLLEISTVTHSDGEYSSRMEYTIPDTIPPDAPTIISYAADAVYGTAKSGDKVFIERDNIVIGSATATSTNTYEVLIAAKDLENGQTIYAYTKDSANNSSAKVEGTVADVIVNLKFDIADTVNAIRIAP